MTCLRCCHDCRRDASTASRDSDSGFDTTTSLDSSMGSTGRVSSITNPITPRLSDVVLLENPFNSLRVSDGSLSLNTNPLAPDARPALAVGSPPQRGSLSLTDSTMDMGAPPPLTVTPRPLMLKRLPSDAPAAPVAAPTEPATSTAVASTVPKPTPTLPSDALDDPPLAFLMAGTEAMAVFTKEWSARLLKTVQERR